MEDEPWSLIIQVVCCSVDHDGLSVDPGDVVADPAMLIAGSCHQSYH